MATRMSRVLVGSLRGRLYSTQVAAKDSPAVGVQQANVNGVRVATVDKEGSMSRVTIIAKAGSRYENGSNLGVSHILRHITPMTNDVNSTTKFLKELEISGGNICAQTTRDYAVLTLNCSRNLIQHVFNVCAPSITRSFIHAWDFAEVNPNSGIQTDLGYLRAQPNVELFELLHDSAYRGTLGNSLFMQPRMLGTIERQQIVDFSQTYFQPQRVAVAATNVDTEEFLRSVGDLKFKEPSSAPVDAKANFIGGESRLPVGGLDNTYIAFAREGPSLTSPELLSAGVLQNILGSSSERVKWGKVNGSKLASAIGAVTEGPFDVNAVNANYTDSGLFGFAVSAPSSDVAKVFATTFETFSNIGSAITDEDVQRGKNQLKASIAMKLETAEGYVSNLAEQVIGSDKLTSGDQVLQMVDAITTADVKNAAKKFTSGKPTIASLGDLTNVPSLDQFK